MIFFFWETTVVKRHPETVIPGNFLEKIIQISDYF